MHDKLVGGALALSIGVGAAGAVQAQQAEQQEVRQEVEPFPVAVEVVQVLKQFDNPEGGRACVHLQRSGDRESRRDLRLDRGGRVRQPR